MNLQIESLELHNFMSYSNATINFEDCGYTLVQGENKNKEDSAKSNGSGKSALFEGIFYALFGETIRGSKYVVNNKGDGTCRVELDFYVNNIPYKIIRGKDGSKSYMSLFVNNEDKSGKGIRDTEKALEEYLPNLTSYLVGSVIVLGQGLPQRFSNNTPSGRKELLEKLSNSDFMVEDLKSKIANRKEELQNKKLECEKVSIALQTKKEVLEKQLCGDKEKLSNMSNVSTLQEELDNLGIEYDDLTSTHKKEILKSIEEINQQIDTLKESQKKLEENKRKEEDTLRDNYQEKINTLIQERATIHAKCNSLFEQIKKYKSIVDVCPTCGQKIVGVKHIDTKGMEIELASNSSIYEQCTTTLNSTQDELKERQQEILLRYSKSLEKCKYDQFELSKKCEEQNKDLQSCERRIKEISDKGIEIKTKIDVWGNQYAELTQSIESLEKEIGKIGGELLYNNNDLNNILNRLSIVNKFNTLITRDFRGVLLEDIIDCVNHYANIYSRQLFGNSKVRLALCGNNLNILFDTKEYESLSTGERLKTDIIVQLSLREMLCETLGFSCNIIVLDELFDGLDEVGCEQVISLLFNYLSDISSTFIITHRHDLPITCDNTIVITKNEQGMSQIK